MKKVFIIFVIGLFLLSGCGNKQSTNSEVVDNKSVSEDVNEEKVQQGRLTEVANLIKQKQYRAAIDFAGDYRGDSDFDILRYFAVALDYKDKENLKDYEDYLSKVPDNYKGILSDEITNERLNNSNLTDKKKEEVINQMVKYLKEDKYQDAMDYLSDLNLPASISKDSDIERLYRFASSLETKKLGDMTGFLNGMIELTIQDIKNIDGELAEKLQKLKEQYKLEIQEQRRTNSRVNAYLSKENPKIGMSKEEVLNSRWGEPEDINRTITEYGTSEQWVYSGYRYIYFDDGIVTAIQD